MTISLGLDIGTNSVGSAWVDTKKKDIQLGVTIFPAGVEDSDTKRGDPKNQKRREKRGNCVKLWLISNCYLLVQKYKRRFFILRMLKRQKAGTPGSLEWKVSPEN